MQRVKRDQPEKQPYTLLIIDDDPLVNSSLHSVLSESFDTVLTYTDPAEALEQIDTTRPDLILLDIFLGNINGLEITIRKVLQNYELRRRVEVLQAQLPEKPDAEILGESTAIQEVIRLARIYAQTDDTTVLITGETGTGVNCLAMNVALSPVQWKN